MTLTAILILIVSAVLHASWNFISKRSKPSAAFLLIGNTLGCMILVPVAIVHGAKYASFPPVVWVFVLTTGMFMALYYTSLAGAYRSGDMSLAYPLARSSPVIVVAVVTFMMGQGHTIGPLCILGIVLIVVGCFLLPMKTFRDFDLKKYLCRTCLFALFAAIGTAGYSIIDAEALKSVRSTLSEGEGVVIVTILYALVEALSSSLFLLLYVLARKTEREQMKVVWKTQRRMAALAGVGIYVTYTMVLVTMSMVKNVSYVAGFRQLSIPIGVLMGVFFLKEPLAKPKALGVTILVAGLILIAVG